MKPDRDTPDEFFEYDAEEFLVSLALLITEGRTPEYSAKGRTEGFHCPPAKSSQPVSVQHECSDKLAQCYQARRTSSEVIVLWKNNSPIMVEVMLLPDCCYSDEGPSSEGTDLKDPAMKQDALLLERWLLEPVPRQSGDRFIEEKTLLLAVRSFVFFSQLSAWLSVSHGAVPRNILYRVSAADGELQWNFSQSPTEHVFPVPNVSQSVALKVRVQSLPRQSSYPVLNCSIHTNLSFYEKRIQEHERSTSQHCDSVEFRERSVPSTEHSFSKPAWTEAPECLLHARTCLSTDLPTTFRNDKLYRTKCYGYDTAISQSKANCSKSSIDTKVQLPINPTRTFKSFALVAPHIHSTLCHPPIGDANPLIGSLLQERKDVIARIAQHLIHCDPPTSHLSGRPFIGHDSSSVTSERFWNSCDNENPLKYDKETPACNASQDSTVTEDNDEGQTRDNTHTPNSSCSPDNELKTSPKPQARRKLFLAQSSELVHSTFLQSLKRTTNSLTCSALSSSTEKNLEKVDTIVYGSQLKDKVANSDLSKQCFNYKDTGNVCSNKCNERTAPDENICTGFSSHLQLNHSKKLEGTKQITVDNVHKIKHKCSIEDAKKEKVCEHNKTQLTSIENYLHKDHDRLQCTETQDKLKTVHDENEDPTYVECRRSTRRNFIGNNLATFERLKTKAVIKTMPLKHSSVWKKHSLDGTSTNAFHPRTGLPLLSSPVPQRKTKSGYFDLDTSFLQFKSLSSKSPQKYLNTEDIEDSFDTYLLSASAPPVTSLSLLGNFEESVLNYRLEPLGVVDGFTAEVGASGLFCPTHMTLPVEVSFYSVSDDNAPSPYMGVITLESLGKRGYRVPPSGTIQVTLFNPNKTVVKMFVVIYDLREMPANQQTFLRQRTFSIPVKREMNGNVNEGNILQTEERTLRYLIHLRFQSSKSGKIYLHRDVRLLFSRKSMEVDSGAAYELKSYTEAPTNPQFSQRC